MTTRPLGFFKDIYICIYFAQFHVFLVSFCFPLEISLAVFPIGREGRLKEESQLLCFIAGKPWGWLEVYQLYRFL